MNKITSLKTTIAMCARLHQGGRRDTALITVANAAHRELFSLTGEVFSCGQFVKVA